jgi:hypothetical protein
MCALDQERGVTRQKSWHRAFLKHVDQGADFSDPRIVCRDPQADIHVLFLTGQLQPFIHLRDITVLGLGSAVSNVAMHRIMARPF